MKQSQPLRIESSKFASFGTSRTVKSRLWFINNIRLEQRVLGFLAKYREKYNVRLYGMVFSGSHYHLLTHFTDCNRAIFYRDFNARAAEAVRSLILKFPGGRVFARRYAEQAVPTNEDIFERFFYCALQPVLAGLCRRISDYPGYNSFYDAIQGKVRKIELINWAKYRQVKRYNVKVHPTDFITQYQLFYERLPGFEDLSQAEYAKMMLAELRKRTAKIVTELERKGHKFATKAQLRKVSAGKAAKNPKVSQRHSKRPLVLTACRKAKQNFLNWYFSIYYRYKSAVEKYVAGDVSVEFPPGTYRPPLCMVPVST